MNARPSPHPSDATDCEPIERGFYGRAIQQIDADRLDQALCSSLSGEIAILRLALREMLAIANGLEDPREALRAFSALGLTAVRLGGLLKLEQELTGSDDSTRAAIAQALSEALDEIARELKLT